MSSREQSKLFYNLQAGMALGERFELVDFLGRGGFGSVFLARDRALGNEVALKFLDPVHMEDEEQVARFKREVLLGRNIRHENACQIYDFGECDGLQFISMEYIQGVSLSERLKDVEHPLTIVEKLRMVHQICLALSVAHRRGVVHRDLKFDNVMLEPSGNVKVMDFGIARSVDAATVTHGNKLLGTPLYMSPERWHGKESDARADIYALGVMMYILFAGRPPFEGSDFLTLCYKHVNDPPPRVQEICPSVPAPLARVIETCVAKDPDDRYPDASSLGAVISTLLSRYEYEAGGENQVSLGDILGRGRAEPPTPLQAEPRQTTTIFSSTDRKTLVWMLSAAVLMLLFVVGAVAYRMGDRMFGPQVEPTPAEAGSQRTPPDGRPIAVASPDPELTAARRDALALFKAGSLIDESATIDALRAYSDVLRLNPADRDARLKIQQIADHYRTRGEQALDQADEESAIRELSLALKADPVSDEIRRLLNEAHRRRGRQDIPTALPDSRLAEARQIAEKLFEEKLFIDETAEIDALRAYQAVLKLNLADEQAQSRIREIAEHYRQLGEAALGQGDDEEAIRVTGLALRADPVNTELRTLFDRAHVLRSQKARTVQLLQEAQTALDSYRPEEARQRLETVLDADSGNAEAQALSAKIEALEQAQAAYQAANENLRVGYLQEAAQNIAALRESKVDWPGLEELESDLRNRNRARELIGQAREKISSAQLEEAQTLLLEAVSLEPTSEPLRLAQGELSRARTAAAEAEENRRFQEEMDRRAREERKKTVAEALVQIGEGRLTEAADLLAKVAADEPGLPELAEAKTALDQALQARKLQQQEEEESQKRKQQLEALLARADKLSGAGKFEQALTALAEAESLAEDRGSRERVAFRKQQVKASQDQASQESTQPTAAAPRSTPRQPEPTVAVSRPTPKKPPTPVPAPVPAIVKFRVQPWANVFLNGQAKGNTFGLKLSLEPGTYRFVFENPELEARVEKKVVLVAGQTEIIQLNLSESWIDIDSRPQASVSIKLADGTVRELGTTPIAWKVPAAEDFELSFTVNGEVHRYKLKVPGGERRSFAKEF